MTTTTTRYGMNKIVLGSDVVDVVTDFNNNWDTLDTRLGIQVCTSSTRPSSPGAGYSCFETDTGLVRKYTGSAWQTVGNAVSASSARPANPIQGDELYESNTGAQRVYNGSAWGGNLSVSTSTSLPANPIQGDFTYLSDVKGTAYYSGSSWFFSSLISCTSSTRPSGSALQTGTSIVETDTKRLLVYNGSSWDNKAFANFVCTSSTRPSSPFAGLEIYETDTALSAMYNGSAYQYGPAQLAATQVVSAASSVTFSSIPPVKRVQVLWRARLATGAADLSMQIDGDTASHYLWSEILARGAVSSGTDGGGLTTFLRMGTVAGTTANYYCSGSIMIDGWNTATNFATISANGNAWDSATSYWAALFGGLYTVGGPHTSLKLSPSSSTFSGEFSIYGWM